MTIIRVEVSTNDTGEGEAYIHKIDLNGKSDPVFELGEVIGSIYTLYGSEGVTAICLYTEEDSEGG